LRLLNDFKALENFVQSQSARRNFFGSALAQRCESAIVFWSELSRKARAALADRNETG